MTMKPSIIHVVQWFVLLQPR